MPTRICMRACLCASENEGKNGYPARPIHCIMYGQTHKALAGTLVSAGFHGRNNGRLQMSIELLP